MSSAHPPLNPAAAGLLPAVAQHAQRSFGLSGHISPLPGEVDFNYRLTDASGRSTLLKLSHPSEGANVVALQNAAAQHLAALDLRLPIAHLLPSLAGEATTVVDTGNGEKRFLRAFTWCEGTAIAHVPKSRVLRHNIGALTARLSQALASLDHTAPQRTLKWNMLQARQLAPLQAALPDVLRTLTLPWFQQVLKDFLPLAGGLPSHPIHNDLNLHNILVGADDVTITGCLDFGDMVQGPRIVDLAVACAYQADVGDAALDAILDVARAYHQTQPLRPVEMDWLIPLTAMRAALTLIITHWTSQQDPGNSDYLLRNAPAARRVLDMLAQRPDAQAKGWIREHLEVTP